jgi:hypothetical protein
MRKNTAPAQKLRLRFFGAFSQGFHPCTPQGAKPLDPIQGCLSHFLNGFKGRKPFVWGVGNNVPHNSFAGARGRPALFWRVFAGVSPPHPTRRYNTLDPIQGYLSHFLNGFKGRKPFVWGVGNNVPHNSFAGAGGRPALFCVFLARFRRGFTPAPHKERSPLTPFKGIFLIS